MCDLPASYDAQERDRDTRNFSDASRGALMLAQRFRSLARCMNRVPYHDGLMELSDRLDEMGEHLAKASEEAAAEPLAEVPASRPATAGAVIITMPAAPTARLVMLPRRPA